VVNKQEGKPGGKKRKILPLAENGKGIELGKGEKTGESVAHNDCIAIEINFGMFACRPSCGHKNRSSTGRMRNIDS